MTQLQDIIFIGVVAITLVGALLAVSLKNVFYNALALILCLFGVACLFIFLNSEFLAVMEVIIYIGAISVAIIFAIMLSQPMFSQNEKRQPLKLGRSALIAGLLFAGLQPLLVGTRWANSGTAGDYSMRAIGKNFLTLSVLPFEAVSLVLLIAIIGALVISEKKRAS